MPAILAQVVPSPSPSDTGSQAPSIQISTSLTTIIACTVPMLAIMYFGALFFTWRYSRQNPRFLNKESGIQVQRYGPVIYTFIVLGSFVEFSLSTWLLFQYLYLQNYPNKGTRDGVGMLLFSSCWTIVTAAFYSLLFIHPTWSQRPIASLGAQSIWVLLTWVFWMAGSGMLNHSLPSLLVRGSCHSVVYCGQIRTLFALSVLEIVTLTGAMLTMVWLVWRSTRGMSTPPSTTDI